MELWERQKGERDKAFYLFTIYRDLGPTRTLPKAHSKFSEETDKPITLYQFQTYSQRYNWVERVNAYDDYQDALERTILEEELREMTKRHARDTAKIQAIAMQVLEDPTVANGSLEPSKIAWIVQTVSNAYEKAGGFERLTRGEATEKIASEVNAKIDADIKHDISVFDKVKRAKKLLEEQEVEE